MTSTSANPLNFFSRLGRNAQRGQMDINPLSRALIIVAGTLMTTICVIAFARAALGLSGDLPHLQHLVLVFHVATVIPCVPLGVYLIIAKKGTPMHKQLGKLWVSLMVVTALSTMFLRPGMEMTWIHIFVPITLRAAYLIVAKARRGDIRGHGKEFVSLYLGALMLPGIAAFVLDGRLMNTMLLG
ncbi:DUF2306 domain-containing protein [Aurantiacibacter marinus]|uniref:DUF2306 domain-containing protein n=1 Tax=Aurantiacibacter marinus TaxID=874156 RepID=A0A0H0XR80_9SPHN|nr:DUF2306 domain-containing protein [Aurantiacibacter marinus]KLI64442.1 hypothetical protein AAV99_02245 [Aurantiacibacter marinus]